MDVDTKDSGTSEMTQQGEEVDKTVERLENLTKNG